MVDGPNLFCLQTKLYVVRDIVRQVAHKYSLGAFLIDPLEFSKKSMQVFRCLIPGDDISNYRPVSLVNGICKNF